MARRKWNTKITTSVSFDPESLLRLKVMAADRRQPMNAFLEELVDREWESVSSGVFVRLSPQAVRQEVDEVLLRWAGTRVRAAPERIDRRLKPTKLELFDQSVMEERAAREREETAESWLRNLFPRRKNSDS
jgi:hypothetical protein